MFEKFAGLVRENLFMESGLVITENRLLTVENCRRIEECSDVFMSFVSGRLLVQVWGCGLCADDYGAGGLVIRGRIDRIDLTNPTKKGGLK